MQCKITRNIVFSKWKKLCQKLMAILPPWLAKHPVSVADQCASNWEAHFLDLCLMFKQVEGTR